MADTAPRTLLRTRGRAAFGYVPAAARLVRGVRRSGTPRTGTRHPLVATAMVLPLAALLAVAFGGWDAVVAQASSVGEMLGR